MLHAQSGHDVRVAWGPRGLARLRHGSDAVVIVDVLSFSTALEAACGRGVTVFPYRWREEARARAFAQEHGALLARPREEGGLSLSPPTLEGLLPGARLVLPSPNGATLATLAGDGPVYAAGLRNARAVALAAQRHGPRVAVIAAGERYEDDDSLRPALEDWIGAGAVARHLDGARSARRRRPSMHSRSRARTSRACCARASPARSWSCGVIRRTWTSPPRST